jgi:hypothetical protein
MKGGHSHIKSIALDVASGKMYWSGLSEDGSGKIQRADLNGSNAETLVPNHGGHSLSLDLAEGKMYWVWYENDYHEDHAIYRADPEATAALGTDTYELSAAAITGDTLVVTVSYSGGCADHLLHWTPLGPFWSPIRCNSKLFLPTMPTAMLASNG